VPLCVSCKRVCCCRKVRKYVVYSDGSGFLAQFRGVMTVDPDASAITDAHVNVHVVGAVVVVVIAVGKSQSPHLVVPDHYQVP